MYAVSSLIGSHEETYREKCKSNLIYPDLNIPESKPHSEVEILL